HSESGDRTAKPCRSDRFDDHRGTGFVGKENKEIIFAPRAEKRVPRRQDQIKSEQQAKNNKENDGKSFNHYKLFCCSSFRSIYPVSFGFKFIIGAIRSAIFST